MVSKSPITYQSFILSSSTTAPEGLVSTSLLATILISLPKLSPFSPLIVNFISPPVTGLEVDELKIILKLVASTKCIGTVLVSLT